MARAPKRQRLSKEAQIEIARFYFLIAIAAFGGGVLAPIVQIGANSAKIVAGAFVTTVLSYLIGRYILRGVK
ncbi:hypothetical protein AGMMS50229_01770 [Campylobacterota bacterium]|nr:hypothetical protein AGMMS50229_01770 [Campylobacterota bacterium]